MKNLVLIAVFTLCLSGVAYAQDPAGPSTAPPTIGGGGSEVTVKGSIGIPGGERRIGNVRISEGKQVESNAGRGPSRDPDANSSGNGPRKDPWEGLREEKETGPKDTGPKDKGPRETGPKDKGPKDTGPRDSGPRGGRRDIN